MVLFLRSVLFNIAFVLVTLVEMVLFSPVYFLLPHSYVWFVPKFWSKSMLWLLKYIANINIKVTGLENLAKIQEMSRSYIIAAKHQSAWETFAILPWLDDPSYILKRELMWIPFFGWYMAKTGMTPIDRGSPISSLKKIIARAADNVKLGRQILIFPEGTRGPVGAKSVYKAGIATIYKELSIPVLPVAHNAGLYWPKSSFFRYPGTIELRFLPPIAPGLDKKQFLAKLANEIDNNCDEMLLEVIATGKEANNPCLIQAQKRLASKARV